MTSELICDAIYYFIFIKSDRISSFRVPPISKARPKKPNFRTGNKKMGYRLSFSAQVAFIMFFD